MPTNAVKKNKIMVFIIAFLSVQTRLVLLFVCFFFFAPLSVENVVHKRNLQFV